MRNISIIYTCAPGLRQIVSEHRTYYKQHRLQDRAYDLKEVAQIFSVNVKRSQLASNGDCPCESRRFVRPKRNELIKNVRNNETRLAIRRSRP